MRNKVRSSHVKRGVMEKLFSNLLENKIVFNFNCSHARIWPSRFKRYNLISRNKTKKYTIVLRMSILWIFFFQKPKISKLVQTIILSQVHLNYL